MVIEGYGAVLKSVFFCEHFGEQSTVITSKQWNRITSKQWNRITSKQWNRITSKQWNRITKLNRY